MKTRKKRNSLFGAPLGTFNEIPFLPKILVEYFDNRGCAIEGLFRITGSIDEVEKFKKKLNRGKYINLSSVNPHVIASLLKLYFRELPEPLFTFEYYSKFIELSDIVDDTEVKNKIKELLSCLPKSNRMLIRYLFEFLTIVCRNSAVNKMHANNLAIVFAPSLLKPKENNSLLSSSGNASRIIEIIIKYSEDILKDEPFPGGHIRSSWSKPKNSALLSRLEQEYSLMQKDYSYPNRSHSVTMPNVSHNSPFNPITKHPFSQSTKIPPPRPPRPNSSCIKQPAVPPRNYNSLPSTIPQSASQVDLRSNYKTTPAPYRQGLRINPVDIQKAQDAFRKQKSQKSGLSTPPHGPESFKRTISQLPTTRPKPLPPRPARVN